MGYSHLSFPDGTLFLVTGGAGFIGSNLCEALLRFGCRVRCLDDLSTGKQANVDLLAGRPGYEFIRGDIKDLATCEQACAGADYVLKFDPTLVRGMSYYTGTIFEITMEGFPFSVAGGGRYDEMVGKFTGTPTCACGFSIGFERIVTILLDQGYSVETEEKKAYLVEKTMPMDRLAEIISRAQEERKQGRSVLVSYMNKNRKFQKEQLTSEGYTEIVDFYTEELKK